MKEFLLAGSDGRRFSQIEVLTELWFSRNGDYRNLYLDLRKKYEVRNCVNERCNQTVVNMIDFYYGVEVL